MFSLRRLAVSASRVRASNTSLSPSTFSISHYSRPKNLGELQKFESLLQRRCNSTYDSEHDEESQGGGEMGGIRFRRTHASRYRGGPRGHPTEPTKVIYVGNLKYEITEKEIEDRFQEFGNIVGVRIPRTTETGVSRGFAYVEFADLAQAAEAIESCHQSPFEGRRLNCQYVHRADFRLRENPESSTLFVGNLSFNTTDQDRTELFKGISGCVDVRVSTDNRTGQPRGFVHADFQDVESAVQAKEKLQGVQLYGRKIRVDFSTPPEERKHQLAEAQSQKQREQAFEQTAKRAAENAEQTQSSIAEGGQTEEKN